jgi:hypothetical protein
MNAADAIILIANANKPSLTGPQLQIFRKGVDADGVAFNEKLFAFANRADESKNLTYNMSVLSDELDKYGILRRKHTERLIAGSAWVHLIMQKVIKDERDLQDIANMERNGICSGIDEINRKLHDYNDNVRFGIIEKRVRNIETRIRDIVNTIEEAIEGEGFAGFDDNSKECLNACAQARRAFEGTLLDYRPDVRALRREQPLTHGILNELKEKFKPEMLYLSANEIETLKKRVEQGVTGFEVKLREQEHGKIMRAFDIIVSGKSDDLEDGIRANLTQLIVTALGVTSEHRYHADIEDVAHVYVDDYFSDFNFEQAYKALSLRFSSGIFEILILAPFLSDDRLANFNQNRANILSLALYSQEAQDRIEGNTPLFPDELPLVNKILFHRNQQISANENSREMCIDNCVQFIDSKINHRQIPLKNLVEQLVDWAENNNVSFNGLYQTLQTTFPDLRANSYNITREEDAVKHFINEVVTKLNPALPVSGVSPQISESKVETLHERYTIAKTQRENTHEWVVESFNEDIRILTEIIRDSVVNAFKLEIPFVENVLRVVQRMHDDADKSTRFRDFYASVWKKINYEVYEEFEAIQLRNNEKKTILEKINEIKENMRGGQL